MVYSGMQDRSLGGPSFLRCWSHLQDALMELSRNMVQMRSSKKKSEVMKVDGAGRSSTAKEGPFGYRDWLGSILKMPEGASEVRGASLSIHAQYCVRNDCTSERNIRKKY